MAVSESARTLTTHQVNLHCPNQRRHSYWWPPQDFIAALPAVAVTAVAPFHEKPPSLSGSVRSPLFRLESSDHLVCKLHQSLFCWRKPRPTAPTATPVRGHHLNNTTRGDFPRGGFRCLKRLWYRCLARFYHAVEDYSGRKQKICRVDGWSWCSRRP